MIIQRCNSPESSPMKGRASCGRCHPSRFDGPESCSNQTTWKLATNSSPGMAYHGLVSSNRAWSLVSEGYFVVNNILDVVDSTSTRGSYFVEL